MRMKISIKTMLAILLVSFVGFAAQAMDNPVITQAKAKCIVGESLSGYLGYPKGSAAQNIQREVREINLKRKAAYASLAKRSGVTIDIAAALTGEKLIALAAKGECIHTAGGWSTVQ